MIIAIAFPTLTFSILIYTVLSGLMNRYPAILRLKKYTDNIEIHAQELTKKRNGGAYKSGLGFLARGIERTGLFSNYKEKIRKKLIKANLLLKPEEMVSISIIVFFLCGMIGYFLTTNILYTAMIVIIGMNLPAIILNRRIKKRMKTINQQLGDTIAILSNSLKAGHSFFQAVESVSREMSGPVSEEFTKLRKEINLGGSTEEALENMVNRIGSDDVELMVTAVLIQRQIGGNLAEILDNISNTIRQRVKTKGEIKTLTAQGRLSGIIISLLPVLLALIMVFVSPDQIRLLITEPIGIMMIVMAVIMEIIGIIFVRKIVNIEV